MLISCNGKMLLFWIEFSNLSSINFLSRTASFWHSMKCSHGFNNRRSSKFRVGSRVWQKPEECQRIYQLKPCRNNNKDEDNSPKTLNEKKSPFAPYPCQNILGISDRWLKEMLIFLWEYLYQKSRIDITETTWGRLQ